VRRIKLYPRINVGKASLMLYILKNTRVYVG